MIGRVVSLLFGGAVAFAQLPPHTVRVRAEDEPSLARVDVVVPGTSRRLAASDFTVLADGKPQKIESCIYGADEPLRLAVVVDDLNLPAAAINGAQVALRAYIQNLRPKDEMAILPTAAGSSALELLTSDHDELLKAVDRIFFNPRSVGAPPESFTVGALGVLRETIDSFRGVPGRKAVLLISDGLRDPSRGGRAEATLRLADAAHSAAVVLYAVDLASATEKRPLLEQGLATVARETGGEIFVTGDVQAALARITQDHEVHYVLGWSADAFSMDYLTGRPRISRVVVTSSAGPVRARSAVIGSAYEGRAGDDDDEDLPVRLTEVVDYDGHWFVNGLAHVDSRAITYTRRADGTYLAEISAMLSLNGESGSPVKQNSRQLEVRLDEQGFQKSKSYGLDIGIGMPLPAPGAYQLRISIRDEASGRLGSARQFLRVDWGEGKLGMSSLLLNGEKNDPLETNTVRRFKTGNSFAYRYDLFNLGEDNEKRSAVELRVDIWRNGVLLRAGDPIPLQFTAAEGGRRSANGTVHLRAAPPGRYTLRLQVTDRANSHSVTRFADFEVRPE